MEVIKDKCKCGKECYAKGKCRNCYCNDRRKEHGRKKYPESSKRWRENNKEKIQGYIQKYKESGMMKTYQRNSQLMKLYGITLDDYNRMLCEQDGRCFLCKGKRDNTLHVDHNHKTGEIRKLLCATCNRYIGMIERDVELLKRVINYIS